MEPMPPRSYEGLIVWNRSLGLAQSVLDLTRRFPHFELYGLAAQMRRAAVSIPSNIAEGSARGSTREFMHFLRVARGSLAELHTQLHLAKRTGYLSKEDFQSLDATITEIGRILNAMLTGLRLRGTLRSD